VETRAGFARNETNSQVQDAGFNAAPLFPGVPGIVDAVVNPVDSGLPRVGISGYVSLGGANNNPSGRITNTYELFSNGHQNSAARLDSPHHQIRYSGRREETRRFLDGASRGSVTFADFDHSPERAPAVTARAFC